MTIKDYLFQMLTTIVTIGLIVLLVIYFFGGMFSELKNKIINNPYPYTYSKPTTTNSNTIYDGSSLNEFTRMLDDLANRLD